MKRKTVLLCCLFMAGVGVLCAQMTPPAVPDGGNSVSQPAFQRPEKPAPVPKPAPPVRPQPPLPPSVQPPPPSSRPQPPPPSGRPQPPAVRPQPPPPPPPPAVYDHDDNGHRRGATTPRGWVDDLEYALKRAQFKKRPVLVLFTGSDWCRYCKMLDKEVFSRREFENFADDNLILVYIDFPSRKKLPAELQRKNRTLQHTYGVRGYPHTLLLNASGGVIGTISGYQEDYLRQVRRIVKDAGYRVR